MEKVYAVQRGEGYQIYSAHRTLEGALKVVEKMLSDSSKQFSHEAQLLWRSGCDYIEIEEIELED